MNTPHYTCKCALCETIRLHVLEVSVDLDRGAARGEDVGGEEEDQRDDDELLIVPERAPSYMRFACVTWPTKEA